MLSYNRRPSSMAAPGTKLDRTSALAVLRRALADDQAQFRRGQWEAIDALVNERRRVLVVQRTGWGKSAVYFIATRLLRDRGQGPTLIVSPLLALMRNQIDAARRLGIHALTVNSTNQADWPDLISAIRAGQADAILISPERLANDDFVQHVLLPIASRIGMVVVDEAHCISDWGHDFRPDYRRLVNVLKRMPSNMPVLATTATANDRVIGDVCNQLGQVQMLRGSLMRESLVLQNLRLPDQASRLAWLAEHLPYLPGTGVVYTLTRRDALQVADWLGMNGIDARAYFSDVTSPEFPTSTSFREYLEDQLLNNRIKVLVATTALGMGYDKPDLGFVVHYQAPGSIVAYYQQVGRAGRAIDQAFGVLLAGLEDEDIHEYFRRSAFPDEQHINTILDLVSKGDGLTLSQIERAVNLRHGQIEKVLKFVSVESPAPLIKDGGRWRRTPVNYRLDHAQIQRLTQQRLVEWQEVQAYIDSSECLMVVLARALDDTTTGPCGKCMNCIGHPVVAEAHDASLGVRAARFLRRAEFPLECNKRVPQNALAEYGLTGNLPQHLRAETGRVLSTWGDAGWGQVVRRDKHTGHFTDELADALVEMICERWRPTPRPAWVTCVPSLTHPHLVPDLAQRLANRLELPFVHAVRKVRSNEPQKLQQNAYHQVANLDGVFEIARKLPHGPVLLLDDVVDSGWTLTLVAALLRQAGAAFVWPVALAAASAGD